MATLKELQRMIEYQLDSLGARNGHHEFEEIARRIARSRIASNILPATGPVSAGGDQGRDAETYRTYKLVEPLKGSTFAGMASSGPIAFGFTIQRDKLSQKIRDDVKKIATSGSDVESIFYFAAGNLSISARHKLQSWCQDTYGIHLEIFDGQAIAEELSAPDLFWIAMEYLGIPREMYPDQFPDLGNNWYAIVLDEWKKAPNRAITPANFEELKNAIRHATFTPQHRIDLPFWLERLTAFEAAEAQPELSLSATYEYLVALLHQTRSLEGQESRIRKYFAQDLDEASVDYLHDAAVLVTFCLGAIPIHAIGIPLEEIASWRKKLVEEIKTRLSSAESMNESGLLQFSQGFLALCDFQSDPSSNAKEALAYWTKLSQSVRETPLFPIETMIDELIRLSRSPVFADLATSDAFTELNHQLDTILMERTGGIAKLRKAKRRAVAHHDNGRLVRAIAELSSARPGTLSSETLDDWIENLLYSAELLIELGLPFAAKYCAIAAIVLAENAKNRQAERYSPEAYYIAARADISIGNWASAADFLLSSFHRLRQYVPETDKGTIESLAKVVGPTLQTIVTVAKRMNRNFGLKLERALGIERESIGSGANENGETTPASQIPISIVAEALTGLLRGDPFSDLDQIRKHSWQANGIDWTVTWEANPALDPEAEELIATLQLLALRLAQADAYLAPSKISIVATRAESNATSITPDATNPQLFHVALPRVPEKREDFETHSVNILRAAIELVYVASLLPTDRFASIVGDPNSSINVLHGGLIIAPYSEILRVVSDLEQLELPSNPKLRTLKDLQDIIQSTAHDDLQWIDKTIEEFSVEKRESEISRRYSKILASIPMTLERLAATGGFCDTVKELRARGWKDWHILLAIKNVSINYWINKYLLEAKPKKVTLPRTNLEFEGLIKKRKWDEVWPVPETAFTVETLEAAIDGILITGEGRNFGFKLSPAVVPSGLRDFLAHRARYWEIDVDHPDPFPDCWNQNEAPDNFEAPRVVESS